MLPADEDQPRTAAPVTRRKKGTCVKSGEPWKPGIRAGRHWKSRSEPTMSQRSISTTATASWLKMARPLSCTRSI